MVREAFTYPPTAPLCGVAGAAVSARRFCPSAQDNTSPERIAV